MMEGRKEERSELRGGGKDVRKKGGRKGRNRKTG